MKKIIAVLLAILSIVSLSMTAFADMGQPMFDNWIVVCGAKGYNFKDEYWDDDKQDSIEIDDYIEPGIKVRIESYYDHVYSAQIEDDRHEMKGTGYFTIPEKDLDKYFAGEKKSISKVFGNDLEKEVKCVVTGDGGVYLRQGPDKYYPSYLLVPKDTKLSYRYVFEYSEDGLKWAYVTYKGKEGWLCLNYTKKLSETAAATEPETTEEATTVEVTTVAEATTSQEVTTAIVTEETAEAQGTVAESGGFFSSTRNVVIVCCIGALILAATAAVILVIIKKGKEKKNEGVLF